MSFLTVSAIVPPATVLPYAASAAPDGWLICDGSAVSRTTYAALFTAIGTTYGSGDGSTTFNLPNTQGVFLRGAGSQTISGTTYSGTRGVYQRDQIQGHWHDNVYGFRANNGSFSSVGSGLDQYFYEGTNNTFVSTRVIVQSPRTDNVNGTPRTGTQTYPANVSLNYIIKI